MKNVLVLLLMLVVPLQAIAAAERNFAHVLGSGSGQALAFAAHHMAEHAKHVPHHHDDDGDDDDDAVADRGGMHVDSSHKSIQHLADYEQGCGMNILLQGFNEPCLPAAPRAAPISRSDIFSDRSTIPLLRPPRAPA